MSLWSWSNLNLKCLDTVPAICKCFGKSRSIKNRDRCLLTSHIALGQHQALDRLFLNWILNCAIVCLKWYSACLYDTSRVWLQKDRWSNQMVMLNWLQFKSISKQRLEPKINLVVQSDSQASHLIRFQDQTPLNSGKTLAMNTEHISCFHFADEQ